MQPHSPNVHRRTLVAVAAAALVSAALVACGGSDGDDDEPTRLSGVVATGAAVPGAMVTIHDADAATANVTTTTDAEGRYVADVSGLRPPLLVLAEGTLDGEPVFVGAAVVTLDEKADNTANVTPLTFAVAALGSNDAELTNPTVLAGLTAEQLARATTLLLNTLRSDPSIAAALGADFDPLTTPFAADGTGIDAVLNKLEVVYAEGGTITIANRAAPIGADGAAPAPVTLTPALVATPDAAPTLPETSTAALPTTAQMTALATKLEACLALPVAERVTMDAGGTVTAVSATCDYAPALYRSRGRTWVEDMGQSAFKYVSLTGLRVGEPVIAAVFAPSNHSGTTYQHPVCNAATCVVMRIPATTASGKPTSFNFLLGMLDGQWDYVGAQGRYAAFVDHRLSRKTQVNTALAAANPGNYFVQDRTEAAIRLVFDPSVGDTAHVRALRWTGPGLPAAGVVSHRSQRCGTGDRFPITNNEGRLEVNNSTADQWWNNNGGTDFIVSAARHDGSAMALPTSTTNWATNAAPSNQDFAPAEFTGSVPAWSVYTLEVFHFGNTSNVPDEVVKLRNATPYEHASTGASKSWPTLSASTIDAYLKPGGSGAGAITSLAHTLEWNHAADEVVSGAYLFGQNRMGATNAENETANYWRRGVLSFEITAFGATSAGGLEFGDPRSGTSMSPQTATSGSNPNPRCGAPGVEPLDPTSVNASYREVGTSFRGSDRKFHNAITFWSN
jgi:hypothetical protein